MKKKLLSAFIWLLTIPVTFADMPPINGGRGGVRHVDLEYQKQINDAVFTMNILAVILPMIAIIIVLFIVKHRRKRIQATQNIQTSELPNDTL